MIIDIVLYNGEQEMFEIRYNILKDVVDEFIVVEFLETFSGKSKQSIPLLKIPKVRHIVMGKAFYKDIFVPGVMYPNFNIEYAQREALKSCFIHSPPPPDALIYVGDVDEIWQPSRVGEGVWKLEQLVSYYFLNNRWNRKWAGTFVGRWQDIKDKSWNTLRAGVGQRLDQPESFPNLIKNGGWHFTNCMSLEEVKRKLESYSHQEYNTSEFKDSLLYRMENNIDYYGIKFPENLDEESLPQYLKDNKEKYSHLWKKS